MAALLTDQFRIFSAKKFIKALEGPDATQSDAVAGATGPHYYQELYKHDCQRF